MFQKELISATASVATEHPHPIIAIFSAPTDTFFINAFKAKFRSHYRKYCSVILNKKIVLFTAYYVV